MDKPHIKLALLFTLVCAITALTIQLHGSATAAIKPMAADEGYVVERDSEVAKNEPGPHQGLGESTGYIFFDKVANLKFSFRKRVLHKGASIGYHLQETDEVYYISGGSGKMTMNGKEFPVTAGDAILTRAGSSHGLMQTGTGDLTIIITFQKK